jgi:hypothetical protein
MCKRGHEMTPENTCITSAGSRQCRTCRRLDFKKYKERIRGGPAAPYNRDKTHCPKGHAYDEENTYFDRNGGRNCKECKRQWKRDKRARVRLLAAETA